MKTLIYLLPFWMVMQNGPSIVSPSSPSSLKVNKSFFRIGDQLITLEKYGSQQKHQYVLVNLHNDPSTINAAFSLVQKQGTEFIRLVNKTGKNVEADFFDMKLVFDPNNIFTSWGRREHLKSNNCWSKACDDYVQQFARFVLNEIPDDKTIVMFREKRQVIHDYLEGGVMENEAREVFRNESMDASSFFITSDKTIFSKFKEHNYSVVWQHAKNMEDDGSLAVFCTKSNRNYLNIVQGDQDPDELLSMVHEVLK